MKKNRFRKGREKKHISENAIKKKTISENAIKKNPFR